MAPEGHSSEDGTAGRTGTLAQSNHPRGTAIADDGSITAADGRNGRIRRILMAGVTSTIGPVEHFRSPSSVATADAGSIVAAETYCHRICRITAADEAGTIAGSAVQGATRRCVAWPQGNGGIWDYYGED